MSPSAVMQYTMRFLLHDLLIPAALGAVATLGFAPRAIYPATIAALIGLIGLWRSVGPRRAAWRGFVFGAACFGTGIHWVFSALRDHAGVGAPLAGLALAALVAYLACYPALAGAMAGATNRLALALWALVVVPAAWCLSELLRGWLFSGFPWLSLGYVTIAAPLNGLAPLLGVHGLSLALMIAAAAVWLLYAGTLVARLVALALITILPVALWSLPPPAHWTRPLHQPLRVMVIQGNIAPADERRPATLGQTLRRYRNASARSDADLVVWPYLARPASAGRINHDLSRLSTQAAERGQTVLAGARWPARGSGFYHSVLALGAGQSGHSRYDKRHRLPFAEYMPGPDWLAAGLAELGVRGGRIRAGALDQPLIHSHGVALGVLIGFEDMFGRITARDLPGAGILIDVAGDDALADTAAPAQHLAIARMRALEAGRPLVRAANIGISAMIGFDGRRWRAAPIGQPARLVARLRPRTGATPYVSHGNRPLWWTSATVVLLALLSAAGRRWRQSRRNRTPDTA